MIEVEKMGKPAVPIVSGRFEGDAIASCSHLSPCRTLRFVIVPRIYRNLTPEESVRNTEPAFEEIVRTLTTDRRWGCPELMRVSAVEPADVERFEGDDRLDADAPNE